VEEKDAKGNSAAPKSRTERRARNGIEECFILGILIPPISSVQQSSDMLMVINIRPAIN
jgi:hypothetical protein